MLTSDTACALRYALSLEVWFGVVDDDLEETHKKRQNTNTH
jgi:hypothetical protein